jgi:phosphoribosylamine--glycine ligase
MKRLLVVGSWAKEQITVENLKQNPDLKIHVYMDTRNPGIEKLADDTEIGDLYDITNIASYAEKKKIEMVLPTTAAPLSAGLIDALEEKNIPAFGPDQTAARLESDKEFTRNLLRKHLPDAVPRYQVFADRDEAMEYAASMDWEVAVKPIGLTEGLGVRVFGDQLKSAEAVKRYITEIIEKEIGGKSRVIIEEKVTGEEFTLQCLVNGTQVIPTPVVQDFKKLLPGEKGANTASMGSYSDSNGILPFITARDYERALDIIDKTLEVFSSETGHICRGFLYGQFMITASGIKLIEYNFRPGDPEWMNTVYILKNNLSEAIGDLLSGDKSELSFEKKATVCKYIVPPGYPEKLNQILEVSFSEKDITAAGADFYYSGGLDRNNKLNVGSERGIAFIAKSDSIDSANEKVEAAIGAVNGDFFHREDIGTRQLIEQKVQHIKSFQKNHAEI